MGFRSANFQGELPHFRWMRVFGDAIFAIGAVAFFLIRSRLMLGKPTSRAILPAGEPAEALSRSGRPYLKPHHNPARNVELLTATAVQGLDVFLIGARKTSEWMYALVIEAGNTNYFALREIAHVDRRRNRFGDALTPFIMVFSSRRPEARCLRKACEEWATSTFTSKYDEHEMRAFTRAVLSDLRALEAMLKDGKVECGRHQIGAEQEMFLVNEWIRPAPLATEVIQEAGDPRLTTEIGRFNLEANLTPLEFHGDCLSRMESELLEVTAVVKRAAAKFNADTLMVGILPTIQQSDLNCRI